MPTDTLTSEGFDFDTLDLFLSDQTRLTETLEETPVDFGGDVGMDAFHFVQRSLRPLAGGKGRCVVGRTRPRVLGIPPLTHPRGGDQVAGIAARGGERNEKH